MPYYDYGCSACNHVFEAQQSIHDAPLTVCPECSSETIVRLPCVPIVFVKGEIKTVAQQAEANNKRLGRYGVQDKVHEILESKKKAREAVAQSLPRGASITPDRDKLPNPWWRPNESKPLDVSTIKDVPKYIATGEK